MSRVAVTTWLSRILTYGVLVPLLLVIAAPGLPARAEVDTLTGNYSYVWSDIRPADGGPLVFDRTYRSLDTRVGVLGPGWTHHFNFRLTHIIGNPEDDMMFTGPQGRQEQYRARGDGTWEPSPYTHSTLRKDVQQVAGELSTTYVVLETDGTEYRFNGGQPFAVTYPNGKGHVQLTYIRDRLREVSTQSGRLRFTYSDDDSRLVAVSDNLTPPRRVQFGYDDLGRLKSVTNRVGRVTTYVYDGETSHLKQIVDARGHAALTMTYDEQGRTLQQANARDLDEGKASSFERQTFDDGTAKSTFVEPPSTFAPTVPTETVDLFDADGRQVSRQRGSAPGDEPFVQIFGPTQNPIQPWFITGTTGGMTAPPAEGGTSISEVEITVAPYLPVPFPQPVKVRVGKQFPLPGIGPGRADGLPRRQVEAMKARASEQSTDRAGRIVGLVVPPGRDQLGGSWRIEYDDEDQILSIAEAGGRTTRFQYDEVGNLVEIDRPDGAVRRFQYDNRDSITHFEDDDGTVYQFAFDEHYRLAHMTITPADGGESRTFDYQHDGIGRVRVIREQVGTAAPVTTEFGYQEFIVTGIWQR